MDTGMKSNEKRSKEWVIQEGGVLTDVTWKQIETLPSGLDHFIHLILSLYGTQVAFSWLDMSTKDIECLTNEQIILALDRIELMWRRRLRSTPGWEQNRFKWVNQVNRAKARALKLLEENKDETFVTRYDVAVNPNEPDGRGDCSATV